MRITSNFIRIAHEMNKTILRDFPPKKCNHILFQALYTHTFMIVFRGDYNRTNGRHANRTIQRSLPVLRQALFLFIPFQLIIKTVFDIKLTNETGNSTKGYTNDCFYYTWSIIKYAVSNCETKDFKQHRNYFVARRLSSSWIFQVNFAYLMWSE